MQEPEKQPDSDAPAGLPSSIEHAQYLAWKEVKIRKALLDTKDNSKMFPAAATETLANFPLLERAGHVNDTRKLVVVGLPYTVAYRVASAADLQILTIIHHRRRYPPSPK